MATTTIQIRDFADDVLEAYKEEKEQATPGIRVEKGNTGSESIAAMLFPQLSQSNQQKLIKKYPALAKFARR